MRILEDDFKCGQFWLDYEDVEPTNYSINSKRMIDSLKIFSEDFIEPYSLDVTFAIFDEYYCVDQNLGSYHLTTNKTHIHSEPALTNSTIKIVPEINSLLIIELYDEIKKKNDGHDDMVGIVNICCYSGLYYLPNKTNETEFTLYAGSGGPGKETKRPIYRGIGIEAPLSEFYDILVPIEFKINVGSGHMGFNTILNWNLYGKGNDEGFLMLKNAFKKLVNYGWTNNMPKEHFLTKP